jgi:hypothetical protein
MPHGDAGGFEMSGGHDSLLSWRREATKATEADIN